MSVTHEARIRVRYAETDQMGVVHHASFLLYMEDARTGLMAERGLAYAELEGRGVGLAVRKTDLRYREPARYGDELVVRASVDRIRGASVLFTYEIRRASDERLLVTGSTELACIDLGAADRPVRMLPPELRELLD